MNGAVADKLAPTPAVQQEPQPCVNCGETVLTQYCGNCGQRNVSNRIAWKNFVQEFTAKWLGFDNQFWRTFLHLTLKPGKIINAYLAGNRVTYLTPLGYYFIVTALVFFGFALLDMSVEEFMQKNSGNFSSSEAPTGRALKLQQDMLHYMSGALRFMVILFVPFFAWVAKHMYKNRGLNFLEHCIILIYSSAHLFWFTLLQAVLLKISGNTFTAASVILSIFYYGFFYQDILGSNKPLAGFLKGVLTYLLGFIVMMVAMIVIVVMIMLLRIKLDLV